MSIHFNTVSMTFDFSVLIISFIVSIVIALIVTGNWTRQLKSVKPRNANEYIRPGSVIITRQIDRSLNRKVTIIQDRYTGKNELDLR